MIKENFYNNLKEKKAQNLYNRLSSAYNFGMLKEAILTTATKEKILNSLNNLFTGNTFKQELNNAFDNNLLDSFKVADELAKPLGLDAAGLEKLKQNKNFLTAVSTLGNEVGAISRIPNLGREQRRKAIQDAKNKFAATLEQELKGTSPQVPPSPTRPVTRLDDPSFVGPQQTPLEPLPPWTPPSVTPPKTGELKPFTQEEIDKSFTSPPPELVDALNERGKDLLYFASNNKRTVKKKAKDLATNLVERERLEGKDLYDKFTDQLTQYTQNLPGCPPKLTKDELAINFSNAINELPGKTGKAVKEAFVQNGGKIAKTVASGFGNIWETVTDSKFLIGLFSFLGLLGYGGSKIQSMYLTKEAKFNNLLCSAKLKKGVTSKSPDDVKTAYETCKDLALELTTDADQELKSRISKQLNDAGVDKEVYNPAPPEAPKPKPAEPTAGAPTSASPVPQSPAPRRQLNIKRPKGASAKP